MSAIAEKIETQVWYRRKDGTIGTYCGSWDGPVKHGPDGPYQRFNCGGGNFRTFSLPWIVKVCEDGKQVWPIPRKVTRDQSGKFVKG
jgi:hypothetical protein